MKTKDQIENEIEVILSTYKIQKNFKKKELDSAKKNLLSLNKCKMYLETNPKEDFIKSEIIQVSNKIKYIEEVKNFHNWKHSAPGADKLKNPLSVFKSEMGYKNLKDQLGMLNFLLS